MVVLWALIVLVWLAASVIVVWFAQDTDLLLAMPFALSVLLGLAAVLLLMPPAGALLLATVWAGLSFLCALHARKQGRRPGSVFAISFLLSPLAALVWIHRPSMARAYPQIDASMLPSSGILAAMNVSPSDENSSPFEAMPASKSSWEDVRSSLDADEYRAFSAVSSDPDHVRIALERVALIERWKAMGPDLRSDRLVLLKSEDMFPELEHRLRQEMGDAAPWSDGRPMGQALQPDPMVVNKSSVRTRHELLILWVFALLISTLLLIILLTPRNGSSVGIEPPEPGVLGDQARLRSDMDEAVRWYRQAAEVGDVRSMSQLAEILDNGMGVPVDDQEAVLWYLKAAVAGDAAAASRLRTMYAAGEGIPDTASEGAFALHEWAAGEKLQGAASTLAAMYEDGQGVEQNSSKALAIYRDLSSQGDKSASLRLANLLSVLGTEKNHAEAVSLYRALSADGSDQERSDEAKMRLLSMYNWWDEVSDRNEEELTALRRWHIENELSDDLPESLVRAATEHFLDDQSYQLETIEVRPIDLDGDGQDEFVAEETSWLIGSLNNYGQSILVFRYIEGVWKLVSTETVGSKVWGPTSSGLYELGNGRWAVDVSRMKEEDAYCCPSGKGVMEFEAVSGGGLRLLKESTLDE
jgi:TPR repeat protein